MILVGTDAFTEVLAMSITAVCRELNSGRPWPAPDGWFQGGELNNGRLVSMAFCTTMVFNVIPTAAHSCDWASAGGLGSIWHSRILGSHFISVSKQTEDITA